METFENQFFKCCNCNINLCPLGKLNHNKNHIIVNYELKNYFCNNHGERYISYCKECSDNFCDLCEFENHNINFLYKNLKNSNLNELRIKIDKLKDKIKDIINNGILNEVIDNYENYYNLIYKIINNFDVKHKNYTILKSIRNINDYNKIIIEDIDRIMDENNKEKKIKYIIDIYEKMRINNEITIKYKVENEEKLNIFGEIFVRNNKDKFHIIINDKNYELTPFLNLKELKIKKEILEIKLKQIRNTKNLSYMFSG